MIEWNLGIWRDQLGDIDRYYVFHDGRSFVVATKGDNQPRFLVTDDFCLVPYPNRGASFSATPGKFEFSVHVDNG